jgi:biopolymer transport protein ExbD
MEKERKSNQMEAETPPVVRRERIRPKKVDETRPFTITSLMDIMTILLCFLLKNYQVNPINITQEPGVLELPKSNAYLVPEDAVPVAITKHAIMVNDELVVNLEERDGVPYVDASYKADGATGFLITPLKDKLIDEMEKQKNIARHGGIQEFKGLVTLIGHRDTPYRLIAEVLYTAGQAQFSKFKFAVIKKE